MKPKGLNFREQLIKPTAQPSSMSRQSILIPSLWSKKVVKRLHFTDESLTIEKHSAGKPLSINWVNVVGVKININIVKGLYFTVGHQYTIHLKCDDHTAHIIEMNSVYGIRKRLYEQLWSDTYRLLFDYHFVHLLGYYMELHVMGQIFTLDGITIYEDGISWDRRPKLCWDELEITVYNRYFVIRNRYGIQYRKFMYFDADWNACLLLDLLRQLINAHNGSMHKRSALE